MPRDDAWLLFALAAAAYLLLTRRSSSSSSSSSTSSATPQPAAADMPFSFGRPVPDDVRLTVTGGWGRPRPRRDPPLHRALDFAMPIGTPIRAIDAGVVIKADDNPAGDAGRWVGIKHDNGIVSRYLHLSELNVAEGARVERGMLIGHSGNTGDSAGPHLHLSLYAPSHLLVDVVRAVGVPADGFQDSTSYGVPIPGEPWIPVDAYTTRTREEAGKFRIPLWRDIVRVSDINS